MRDSPPHGFPYHPFKMGVVCTRFAASAGVFEPVLVLLPGGCEDQDRGVADRLQRAASAHIFVQPDARAIRVGMAAIPDREGGEFLNFGLDQRWGEAHSPFHPKIRVDRSLGAGLHSRLNQHKPTTFPTVILLPTGYRFGSAQMVDRDSTRWLTGQVLRITSSIA